MIINTKPVNLTSKVAIQPSVTIRSTFYAFLRLVCSFSITRLLLSSWRTIYDAYVCR